MRDNDLTRLLVPAFAAALTLAACGGGSSAGDSERAERTETGTQTAPRTGTETTPRSGTGTEPRSGTGTAPSPAPPKPGSRPSAAVVRVVTDWADSLRAGHVRAASGYFDLPVVVQNGGPTARLTSRRQVLAFNRTLPCGARVLKAARVAEYTVVLFLLTTRPGSPGCSGEGEYAATAFRLRHGKISQWLRVGVPPSLVPDEGQEAPGGPLV